MESLPLAEAKRFQIRLAEIFLNKLGLVCSEEIALDPQGRPIFPSDVHVNVEVLKRIQIEAMAEALDIINP
jgi:hypothetical protein